MQTVRWSATYMAAGSGSHMRIAPESSRTLARLLRRLFLGRRCPDSQSMTSGGPMGYPGPQPQGLYDPAFEHDACGVAFVADIHGRRSHDVVPRACPPCCRMDHRGARGAEPNTGDGAGIMIQIPDEFLRDVVDFELPPAGSYATGLAFLPHDASRPSRKLVLDKYALVEGAQVLGWRDVPTDPKRPRRDRARRDAAHRAGLHRRGEAQRARQRALRPRSRPGRLLRAQAGRAGDPRARHRALPAVAFVADDHLQGHAHP